MQSIIAALVLIAPGIAGGGPEQSELSLLASPPADCAEAQVYFEYGEDRLESHALATVDRALGRLGDGPIDFIIVGHVDTAEVEETAMAGLSDARAITVAAEFARRRPGGTYRVSGIGASRLARQTAPGRQEALNRRVDIRACPV
jgi:outer membrane protein OmpA-like peptidoglycan-associated protein